LAHNERHPVTRKPVAKIIHNFGRTDRLDREQSVRLCRSIARVCDVAVVDPHDDNQDVAKINVLLAEGLKIDQTAEFGLVLAVEALWNKIGLRATFCDIAKADKLPLCYERALLAMTSNRLCTPESKPGVWDRWLDTVWLPSCQDLKLRHMYEAMDMFQAHAAEVEKAVFFKTANLFNLEADLIFYDTTTATFTTDYEDDPNDTDVSPRQFGHSKEGTWSTQVVVALAVTREGIPVRSQVLPGNTTDVNTVEQVRADLRGWNLGRAMFVADSGMNSNDNRTEITRACGKYILACRMACVAEIKRDVLSKKGRYTIFKDNLRAWEVIVGDGVRRKRYILCFNPKEAKRQHKHREEVAAEEIAEKGYCASKGIWFYGVKLHVLGAERKGTLPLPEYIGVAGGGEHDLPVFRQIAPLLKGKEVYADKAYADTLLKQKLMEDQDTELMTPVKLKKGQKKLSLPEQLFSTAVSRVRQPIESLFSWLQEKTGIEIASKVRSYNGLMVHIFGKLAAAMLMLVFNS